MKSIYQGDITPIQSLSSRSTNYSETYDREFLTQYYVFNNE